MVDTPITVIIVTLECGHCGHKWHPKTDRFPKSCPACKTPMAKWIKINKLLFDDPENPY